MFQGFITAPESTYPSRHNTKDSNIGDKQSQLKRLIRNVINSMPCEEICQQAVLNIGLPYTIVDFQKILKRINTENNINSLNLTYLQLIALKKQSMKLNKGVKLYHSNTCSVIRLQTRKETVQMDPSQDKSKSNEHYTIKKAIKDELAFRIKSKHFYSTDKINKKLSHIKKKAEKAKQMNQKSLKIFTNHKEIEYNQKEQNNMKAVVNQSKQYLKKFHVSNLSRQQNDQVNNNQQHSVYFDFVPFQLKSKTAVYKQRDLRRSRKQNTLRKKFSEYRRKQARTKENKIKLEKQKEIAVINKFMDRQIKLEEITNKLKKASPKNNKRHLKYQTSLNTEDFEKLADRQNEIKQKCSEKQFMRQLQLRQKIERVRQQLRLKQQRRQAYKLKLDKQHEQNMSITPTYQMNSTELKEQISYQQQLIIKKRHEQLQNKQKNRNLLHHLKQLTDNQLTKSLSKLNNKYKQSMTYQSISLI